MRDRKRLVWSAGLLAAVVLVVDQLTKTWALGALEEGVRTPVLGDLLGVTLVFNPGAALSLGTGMTWLLTLLALTVTVVIIRVAGRLGSRTWALALGLLLGGALGNLGDRLFREPGFARGHVVDFIAYLDLFVGNVADIAIVVAAGLIMLQSVRGIGVDGSRSPASDAEEQPSADDPAGEPDDVDPGSVAPPVTTSSERTTRADDATTDR